MNISKLLIILVLVFIILSKFVWIDRFPPGLAHDEAIYSLNGISYLQTGSDLTSYSFPLSIFRSETEGFISTIPALIYGFYYQFVSPDVGSLRILMTLINITTAYVFYKFVSKLIRNETIAKISVLVFLVSPWGYFLSRWGADTPWALLFTLLSFYFLITAENIKGYFLATLFVILTILSYHGAKLVIIPSITILAIYKYQITTNKQFIKYFLCCIVVITLLYFSLDYILPGNKVGGRIKDLQIFNHFEASSLVDSQRRNSIENNYQHFFVNKPIATIQLIAKKYFSVFSPEVLLFSGDGRATYRYSDHGLIYLFEIVFILSGLVFLYKKRYKEFWLILTLTFVAPITTAMSTIDTSQVNRSYLLLPLLIILVASGIYHVSQNIIFIKRQKLYYSLIIVLYLIFYMNFINFYFMRYPITSSENTFFTDKIISTYISHSSDNNEIFVVNSSPKTTLYEHLFFTNDFSNIESIKKYSKEPFKFNNVHFMSSCPKYEDGSTYLISRTIDCDLGQAHEFEIIDQKDAGMLYTIHNDTTCSNLTLDSYKRFHLLEDYDVDSLDRDNFCKKWIFLPKR